MPDIRSLEKIITPFVSLKSTFRPLLIARKSTPLVFHLKSGLSFEKSIARLATFLFCLILLILRQKFQTVLVS